MSIEEIEKLKVYQQLDARTLKQKHASAILGVTTRQIRNTLKDYRALGAAALVSKKRGVKSNRAYRDELKTQATSIILDKYTDFGPTLASEYLLERHQLKYSKETLRIWMTEAGIWKAKKEKQKVVHQPRPRRECFGELLQIDGSPHKWFEERGNACCLITFIDDATSKILLARFFPA